MLTGTTYGIGATLLFHRPPGKRSDTPPKAGQTPKPATAAATPRRRKPRADGDGGTPRGAVHRARLSDHGHPRAVCKGHGGVLVVGMSADGEPLGWLTDDGSQWIEHTLEAPERGRAEVWGVAAHQDLFVAVGSTIERDERRIAASGIVSGADAQVTFTERRRTPTIWWTTDCARWSGQTLDDVVGPHAHLIAIACNGGRLVAVGSTLDEDGAQGAGGLVLTSTNGRTWRRGALDAGPTFVEGSFTAVAAAHDRWFATSVDIEGGTVWTSLDGRRWSPVPTSSAVFRGVTLQGIGIDRDRVVVAGTPLIDPRPRYFVSRDGGNTWKPAKLDVRMLAGPDALVGDLTVISGDVVVVGTHRGAPVLEGGDLLAAAH